jgi:tetratricopeptide (TPR) repeat protein
MLRLLAIASTCALLSLSSPGQIGHLGGHSQPAGVAVHVQLQNGRPAPGNLLVQLLSSNSVPISSAFTNDVGEAALGPVPSGTDYYLQISGDGFQTARTSFFIPLGEALHNEFVTVAAKDDNAGSPTAPGGSISVFDLKVPKGARKEMEKGNDFAQKREWLDAARHYQKAVDKYPQYVGAYNNLGTARMNLNDPAGAKDAYRHAVSIDAKYAQGWLNLATLAYFQRDVPDTEQDLLKAEAVEPMNVRVLTFLAQTEFKLKKYDQAEQYARRVHRLPHVGFAMAHVIGGSAYENQGRIADALAQYQLYLQEAPDGRLVAQVKAEVEKLQKQLTGAQP